MSVNDDHESRLRASILPSPNPTSSERALNKITDKVSSFSGTADTFDLLGALKTVVNATSKQDAFEPLRVVIASLDQIVKVHPFLAVAVIPFKAVMTLELKRRDNDRRILVLVTQMTDMMSHLCALPSNEVKSTQQAQLHEVLSNVKDKIKECGNAIDVYYKTKLIVKIVKAFSWQDKLEQFAQDISELKDLLKVKLLLIINALAGETNAIVTASDAKMDEILKLLRRRTNAEADLSKYIDSRGGIETIVNDDKLMYRLVTHVEGRSDSGLPFAPTYAPAGYGTGRARAAAYSSAAQYYGPTSMYPSPPQPTRVPPPDGLYYDAPPAIPTPFPSFARVGRGSRRPTRAPELYGNLYTYNEEPVVGGEQSLTVQLYKEEIQSALSTDLSVILRRNEEIWTFKLDHFSGTIMRHFDVGTDRVLKAITEGPHTGIEHPELRAIWEQEKWRGSVGGMQLLQAVQDFMQEEDQMQLAASRSESWAIHFLSVPYRMALLQELDRDASGFVSVAEANAFVRRKPSDMSLLLWFAHSAVTWTYEVNECRGRIRDSWTKLAEFTSTLPDVTRSIYQFESYVGPEVDALLVALRIFPRRIAEIADHADLVDALKRQMGERLEALRTNLDKVGWQIDGPATLRAIAGDLPIETYLLPLLSLLIAHFVDQVVSTKAKLSESDVFAAKDTLMAVLSAVDERYYYLVECYPLQSVSDVFFGLYSQWTPREPPIEPSLPKFTHIDPESGEEKIEPRPGTPSSLDETSSSLRAIRAMPRRPPPSPPSGLLGFGKRLMRRFRRARVAFQRRSPSPAFYYAPGFDE